MVSIVAFQAAVLGSNPGQRKSFTKTFLAIWSKNVILLLFYFIQTENIISWEYINTKKKAKRKIVDVFNRSRRDFNTDSWIQSPKCSPLHHGTRCFAHHSFLRFITAINRRIEFCWPAKNKILSITLSGWASGDKRRT